MSSTENRSSLRRLAAWSTIVFPLLMLVGFALHPQLLSWDLVRTADQLAVKFHLSAAYHYGHLLVLAAVPFILAHLGYWLVSLRGPGSRLAFWGGVVGAIGAVVLAVDKGALCLVLSAFDTLPQSRFEAFVPYLQVIVDRAGLVKIVWLLTLLPLGALIQAIGLYRARVIARWQLVCLVSGLVLLNNPDIGLVSTVAGALLCAGYVPLGITMLRTPTATPEASLPPSCRACRAASRPQTHERPARA